MKIYLVNQILPGEYVDILNRYGKCMSLPSSETIPPPVGRHPDTLVGKIGGEIFVGKRDGALMAALDKEKIKYRVSSNDVSGVYPHDCSLNFFTAGRFLFGRTDSLSHEALEYAVENGYTAVDVRQGYAHCSAALVGEGVITADGGIFRELSRRGVPTLKISDGSILLPPYEYGFIGGACADIGDGNVIFFGSLNSHPDGEAIRGFCKKMGARIIEGNGSLRDYGGIVTIYQQQ